MAERGFTLTELMIVTLVIGILALIVFPQLNRTKDAATLSTLRADLRNLSVAQESHFAEELRYTDDLEELEFRESTGVEITLEIGDAGRGWAARAEVPGRPGRCAIFRGQVEPLEPARDPGVLACEEAALDGS